MTGIDICICTYRRQSLADTLASLAGQAGDDLAIRIIVADNDVQDSRREEIENTADELGLNLKYVHAPARNISVARNACLDAAAGDWLVFIDDDEVATSGWLLALLSSAPQADIVFGPVEAVYPPDAPTWMIEGDFHSSRLQGNDREWNGHTGNVLIAMPFIRRNRLRFNEQQGQTGGEDTLFFFNAMRAGARFGYAPDAIVRETIDPGRISLRWLFARRYRSGQTHHLLLSSQGKSASGTFTAFAKVVWCLVASALSVSRPANAARSLLRAGLHAGVIAAALGFAPYREYGRGNVAT